MLLDRENGIYFSLSVFFCAFSFREWKSQKTRKMTAVDHESEGSVMWCDATSFEWHVAL